MFLENLIFFILAIADIDQSMIKILAEAPREQKMQILLKIVLIQLQIAGNKENVFQ